MSKDLYGIVLAVTGMGLDNHEQAKVSKCYLTGKPSETCDCRECRPSIRRMQKGVY